MNFCICPGIFGIELLSKLSSVNKRIKLEPTLFEGCDSAWVQLNIIKFSNLKYYLDNIDLARGKQIKELWAKKHFLLKQQKFVDSVLNGS